jgi:5-hydroxyisourate hydrolase-like protein (transthyretin family)
MESIHETTLNRTRDRTRNYTKLIIYSCLFVFVFVWFSVLPSTARAATLSFVPSSGSYTIGQTFPVSVYVSSTDQAMNAASGIISFPQDKLEVTSLSKTGSIFSLWVQEPSFSNNAGTINFEGIVLNPGYLGASGKILSATFRTKAAGTANLSFSSSSVLANDGQGTNILAGLEGAQFSLGGAAPIVSGTPSAPKISSPTHPDQNKWYAQKDAKFTWNVSSGITSCRLLVSKIQNDIPTVLYAPAISEKEVTNLDDGVWYFHVQFKNDNGWGAVSHFRFQIDTEPPAPFEIKVKEGTETTNPQPTLIFETKDELSGIDYYEVKIDQQESIKTAEKEYKIPVQSPGKHTVIVKAVDRAGNYALAMTEISILPIAAPIITDYPHELIPGSLLAVKGTALPEVTLKVYLQEDNREAKIRETKSDQEGKWSYIEAEPVENGVYQVWTEAVDIYGAKSNLSEKISILVSPPVFIRIGKLAIDYLTTIMTLLTLILAIIFVIFWAWRKIREEKRKIRKETGEAEKALYQAFKTLKEKVEEQVAKLDGKPGLNKREEKICDDLKESLRVSEEFIGKEIEDIEKTIK